MKLMDRLKKERVSIKRLRFKTLPGENKGDICLEEAFLKCMEISRKTNMFALLKWRIKRGSLYFW